MKFNISKFKRLVLDWMLTKILNHLSKDSNYIKHAEVEFELAGYNKGDEMNQYMKKQVIQLLQLFATHGHSGTSASFAINLFTKLAKWEIISPLTFRDEDWSDDSFDKGCFQHKRDSSIFKDDKGIYNIDAFVKTITKSKFVNSNEIVDYSGGSWTGSIFLMKDGVATGLGFRKVYFKQEDIDKCRVPLKTIYIPVTQIEVQKDDWLTFVDNEEPKFRELYTLHNIEWFEVEGLKAQPIVSLTSSHGY